MANDGGLESDEPRQEAVPPPRSVDLPRMVAACGFALGSLLAGGAVAYHLLIYVPGRDGRDALHDGDDPPTQRADLSPATPAPDPAREAADLERREQVRRQSEAAQEAQRQAARRVAYQGCLERAEQSYFTGWDRQCKVISDRSADGLADCLRNTPEIADYCRRIHAQRPPSGCTLPAVTANEIEARHEAEKTRCLQEMNAGLL